MKKCLLLLTVLMLACGPAFAQAPPPNFAPPPEEPVVPQDFTPQILQTELIRAVTVGNPPQKPRWFMPFLPVWFKRPLEIPKSYPMRNQDGERFFN